MMWDKKLEENSGLGAGDIVSLLVNNLDLSEDSEYMENNCVIKNVPFLLV